MNEYKNSETDKTKLENDIYQAMNVLGAGTVDEAKSVHYRNPEIERIIRAMAVHGD